MSVLTGAAAGAATPGLFLLAGNFDPVQEPVRPIYENTKELPALLAAALLKQIPAPSVLVCIRNMVHNCAHDREIHHAAQEPEREHRKSGLSCLRRA